MRDNLFTDPNFGIQVYLNQGLSLTGKIKCYPSDFHVTEISLNGDAVVLDPNLVSLGLPTAHIPVDIPCENSVEVYVPPSEESEVADKLRLLIGSELLDSLRKFSEPISQKLNSTDDIHNDDFASEFLLGKFPDKSIRTKVHKLVRSLHPFLQTNSSENILTALLDERYPKLCEVLTREEADGVLKFVSICENKEEGNYCFKPEPDKDRRNKIHKAIYNVFGGSLKSHTLTKENQRNLSKKYDLPTVSDTPLICIFFRKLLNKTQDNEGPHYTRFVMEKKNKDTLTALHDLGRILRCGISRFSYAGIKDKRAVTLQEVCVMGVKPETLKHNFDSLNKSESIRLGSYRASNSPIPTGALQGNRFSILVREIGLQLELSPDTDGSETSGVRSLVAKNRTNLVRDGFCNYFGKQRFGDYLHPASSCHIGLAMLRGDFTKAVNLLLTPNPNSDPSSLFIQALHHYQETKSAREAFEMMPSYRLHEKAVLEGISKSGGSIDSCIRALMKIPYLTRTLYVHALTSLIWNHATTQRISKYGLQVVPGDLVFGHESSASKHAKLEEPIASLSTAHQGDRQVVLVDASSVRKYSVYDVVLPLCGASVIFPTHSIGEFYADSLAQLGLSNAESFRVTDLSMKFPGAYREILSKPIHFDLEWLQPQEGRIAEKSESKENFRVNFDLPSSSYATILIRELLKSDI